MTRLFIIQQELSTQEIEDIICQSKDFGIFFQFDGVNSINNIKSHHKDIKIFACRNSIERRNISLPVNLEINICSLGTLHELCTSYVDTKVYGKLA